MYQNPNPKTHQSYQLKPNYSNNAIPYQPGTHQYKPYPNQHKPYQPKIQPNQPYQQKSQPNQPYQQNPQPNQPYQQPNQPYQQPNQQYQQKQPNQPKNKIFRITTNRNNLIPITNLKDLVANLLRNIMPEDTVQAYIADQYMPIWTQSITSDTYDPTYNYEEHEYLGDRVEKYVYPKYLIMRNPSYTRKDITNIDMAVMEKETQYQLSHEMGLMEFVKVPHHQNVPVGVGGDVYEGFFGALDEISETMVPMSGIMHSYNLTAFIFNQNIIPDYLAEGNPKMIVEQIFKQLGLKNMQPITTKEFGKFISKITLNDESADVFKKYKKTMPTLLGEARGNVQNTTIINAYKMTKATLETYGVDDEFITLVKTVREEEKKEEEKNKDKNEENKEDVREMSSNPDVSTDTDIDTKNIKTTHTHNENISKTKQEIVLDKPIKEIIMDILSSIITNPKVLDMFVTQSRLDNIWSKVFTTTVKPDDDLKYFGEIVIKGLLARHLYYTYKPDSSYTKDDFNNIMSNISKSHHLFLTTKPLLYLNDRLEPFLGAVDKISDEIYFGSSIVNDYRLIEHIFKKNLIPYDFRFTHPKTALQQLLSPFLGKDSSKPIVNVTYDDKTHLSTFEISLTPDQLSFLHHRGFTNLISLLAYHSGQGRKQTEKETYQLAMQTLADLGIDKQWATQLKYKMDFQHPKILPYLPQIEAKQKKDRLMYLYFASPSKTTTMNDITIQLVGVKKDGEKVILSTILAGADMDRIDAKVQLVTDYIAV